jgi:hypothetical protein
VREHRDHAEGDLLVAGDDRIHHRADHAHVITAGTSLGIGIIQKPSVFLNEGDVVEGLPSAAQQD